MVQCKIFSLAVAVVVTSLLVATEGRPQEILEILFVNPADSNVVESTIREVRAAPQSEALEVGDLLQAPAKDYHHTYEDEDTGDKGFIRKKSDKGQDGYQKFASFHKKGSDKYGYEKHDSFGKEQKSDDEAGGKSGKVSEALTDASSDDGKAYEVNEDLTDDSKEETASYTAADDDYDHSKYSSPGHENYETTSGGDHHFGSEEYNAEQQDSDAHEGAGEGPEKSAAISADDNLEHREGDGHYEQYSYEGHDDKY